MSEPESGWIELDPPPDESGPDPADYRLGEPDETPPPTAPEDGDTDGSADR